MHVLLPMVITGECQQNCDEFETELEAAKKELKRSESLTAESSELKVGGWVGEYICKRAGIILQLLRKRWSGSH